MDEAFRARAAARRLRGMWSGSTRSHEELDALDLDYGLSLPPHERIRAASARPRDLEDCTELERVRALARR